MLSNEDAERLAGGQVDQMVTSKDFTEPSHRSLINSARDIEWIN